MFPNTDYSCLFINLLFIVLVYGEQQTMLIIQCNLQCIILCPLNLLNQFVLTSVQFILDFDQLSSISIFFFIQYQKLNLAKSNLLLSEAYYLRTLLFFHYGCMITEG